MKVALLLTGLPRKVSEGYSHTWKHIIENYDTDIYLHAWKDEEWDKISEIYPFAKSIQIQEPFKFTKYKEGIKLPHTDTSRPLPQYDVMSCFRQLPMFYSWQMGYKPLYDSTIKYDIIIRSRYDLGIHRKINLHELNMDLINHESKCLNLFDDNLCITNKENSDILFCNIFDEIIKNSRKIGTLSNAESSYTDVLKRCNLIDKAVRNSILNFTLLRENKLWWGDENGNII